MGNEYDWKKIIRMVAVIGVLCLFVGIATRVFHKSQTSLSDYAEKNPEVALASPEKTDEEKEIYDNFFFTEEKDGYKFHILYYNSKHEKSTAEVISLVSDPDETLKLFYDLYKAEHEFKNITEIQDFADRFKAETDEHNQD